MSITEEMRLEYNEALTAYKNNPTEENKTKLNKAKDVILLDIGNRWLEQNKVFQRQQGVQA